MEREARWHSGRLRQEDFKFESLLDNLARLYDLKK